MATKIQIRRGTAASWASINPTLSSGELGLETDTNKVKIGDGSTVWNSLNYFYDQSALSQSSASATYIPLTSQQTIINTASAAAVAYADGLTTTDIAEGTNLYFTNERAIDAASATYILQTSQQGIINSASAAAVTYLVDTAPATLDTLNELAAALGDDENFATTIINTISSASANSISSANSYTDTEVAEAIVTASAAAVAYADGLTTSDIAEGTNLYFTNQRAIDAASATYILQTSQQTIINTASAAAVASSNSYTDTEVAEAIVTASAAAVASSNSYTDIEVAEAIVTASAAAVAYADGLTTADIAENTNLYFTNERAVNAGSATYILQTNQQGIINSASAAAVTAVLDGAPGALDTLNELAAALGDDSNFATTVTNSLSTKLDLSTASATYLTQSNASSIYAPKANPTFTGTVTIPTLDLTNALPIADGGTGATTASAAFNALAPSQASNSGKYLTTNGTTTSWATVEGGGGGGGTASDDTIFKAQLFFGGIS